MYGREEERQGHNEGIANFCKLNYTWSAALPNEYTGLGQRAGPRLREFCRKNQAELVRKSRNKVHKTWGFPLKRALILLPLLEGSFDIVSHTNG